MSDLLINKRAFSFMAPASFQCLRKNAVFRINPINKGDKLPSLASLLAA